MYDMLQQTTRQLTATTFTKAMIVMPFYNIYGVDTSKKWPTERINNEVRAMLYVRENTTIPVPTVLATGESPFGQYFTAERVHGVALNEIGNKCGQPRDDVGGRLPLNHREKRCAACRKAANANAERFVRETMLPQLAKLRSCVSGLDGVVIPPPWVTEVDRRAEWRPKTTDGEDFVFCHGDLGPQNIICDPLTLEVVGVVDWENAGFYDERFLGLWAVEEKKYYDIYRDEKLVKSLVEILE